MDVASLTALSPNLFNNEKIRKNNISFLPKNSYLPSLLTRRIRSINYSDNIFLVYDIFCYEDKKFAWEKEKGWINKLEKGATSHYFRTVNVFLKNNNNNKKIDF